MALIFHFNPFPNDIFLTPKLKEFADDTFTFDENSRKLAKHVENNEGKGAISPFPKCFQQTCTSDA